ncbi:MAG: hypothetical protein IPP86_16820 [Bacteroidetes bacterium]|nr:hypothetical protein [Bacteroidota bacterium]
MEEIKANFQLCYFDLRNAKGIAMNLLMFGYRQFADTYLYKNKDQLKIISEHINTKPPKIDEISGFALNNLIDSVKIHICIENFLKAILLANGIVIHKLDKNIFNDLSTKQKNEPVFRDEVVRISKWEENSKIKLPLPNQRLQILGIQEYSLGTNILMKPGYLSALNFSAETAALFEPYLEYRDNLHYYMDESITLTKSTFSNFERMIDFVNKNHVVIQNVLVDELNKGDEYKLKRL